jgi:CRP/FNR family cyclic AMP-dependent transcriptional regulator
MPTAEMVESDPLAHIPLFGNLTLEERAELSRLLVPKRFSPGQHVVWVGEAGKEFFVIEQGRVEITLPDDHGRELVLASLGPGQFFGEISLLDGGPRTATARAATDCTLMELGRADFLQFVRKYPSAAIHMMTVLGQRQRDTNEKLRGIKNVNEVMEEKVTASQRTLERVAACVASNGWLIANLVFFALWIVTNVTLSHVPTIDGRPRFFDEPPTLFTLGFIITMEAILLSMFVLASQKRQADRDRVRADLDYQVNVKAHLEVMQLHQKVDRLEMLLEKLTNADGEDDDRGAKPQRVRPT